MGCTGIGSIKIFICVKEESTENKEIEDTPIPNLIFWANNSTTLRILKFFILEKTSI